MNDQRILELIRFGNPLLRQVAARVPVEDIASDEIQNLIANIRYTNKTKEYGIGLAAPQVGASVALSVIGIKPTPSRPNLEPFESVIINPEYQPAGDEIELWEGCQSCGSGNDTLFAKAVRFAAIQARWYDEQAQYHDEKLEGFVAHVFQHETDHLNSVLFVDHVKDTTTYMMADEYRQRIVKPSQS